MREGNFDVFLIESLLELPRKGIAESPIVFLNTPGSQKEVERGISKSSKNNKWVGFVQALKICFRNLMHHLEDVPDVFVIGDADIEVESTYRVSSNVDKLGLDEGLVGNAY